MSAIATPALTVISGRKLAGARRSKKYLALTEILGMDDAKALAALGFEAAAAPQPEPLDPRIAALMHQGGFTEDVARTLLAAALDVQAETAPAEVVTPVQIATPVPTLADMLPAAPSPIAAARTPQVPSGTLAPVRTVGDLLVEQQGLTYTKGRVYLTGDMIEAAVRVRKTGTPEIVRSAKPGRTSAVLMSRTDGGEVAAQNLRTPEDADA